MAHIPMIAVGSLAAFSTGVLGVVGFAPTLSALVVTESGTTSNSLKAGTGVAERVDTTLTELDGNHFHNGNILIETAGGGTGIVRVKSNSHVKATNGKITIAAGTRIISDGTAGSDGTDGELCGLNGTAGTSGSDGFNLTLETANTQDAVGDIIFLETALAIDLSGREGGDGGNGRHGGYDVSGGGCTQCDPATDGMPGGNGGNGGSLTVISVGDIEVTGTIDTGAGDGGPGGRGGDNGKSSLFPIKPLANPNGTQGGAGGDGGAGGAVSLDAAYTIYFYSAHIDTNGGFARAGGHAGVGAGTANKPGGNGGSGGAGGSVTVSANDVDKFSSLSITASGRTGFGGGFGGNSYGGIDSSDCAVPSNTFAVQAATGNDVGIAGVGGAGGSITFDITDDIGTSTNAVVLNIQTNGGVGGHQVNLTGGWGKAGKDLGNCPSGFVGAFAGPARVGGVGGAGGDVTIEAGGLINVASSSISSSGGVGGGGAHGGEGTVYDDGSTVCCFNACDGGAGASGGNAGRVTFDPGGILYVDSFTAFFYGGDGGDGGIGGSHPCAGEVGTGGAGGGGGSTNIVLVLTSSASNIDGCDATAILPGLAYYLDFGPGDCVVAELGTAGVAGSNGGTPIPPGPCCGDSSGGCYADFDVSTGVGTLDIFDFLAFQAAFVNEEPRACDCSMTSGPGLCDIFDFLCFQSAFAAGCP